MKRINTKLMAKIAGSGLSIAEIAARAGVTQQTLRNYLNGRGSPVVEKLHSVARVLGCEISDIVVPDEEGMTK